MYRWLVCVCVFLSLVGCRPQATPPLPATGSAVPAVPVAAAKPAPVQAPEPPLPLPKPPVAEVRVIKDIGVLYQEYQKNEVKAELDFNRGQVLELHFRVSSVAKDERGFYVGFATHTSTRVAFPDTVRCYLSAEAQAAGAALKKDSPVILRGKGLSKATTFRYQGNTYPVLAIRDCVVVPPAPAPGG